MTSSDALAIACEHYASTLACENRGGPGREYLASRGISPSVARIYGVGYAMSPSEVGWHELLRLLRARGIADDDALEAGVIRKSKRSAKLYDALAGRLVFPIIMGGAIRSFCARAVPGALSDGAPRYVARGPSASYDPRVAVYGLELCDADGPVVVVEGALDVLGARSRGFLGSMVAQLGKSLHRPQAMAIAELGRDVVLVPDGDATGIRSIQASVSALFDVGVPLDDIQIARLPSDLDPGDATLEQLEGALAAAKTARDLGVEPRPFGPPASASAVVGASAPEPGVIERARAYLATMDPAIAGSGGHDRCYAAATAMVHGFCLDATVALDLLETEYNPRCDPPWSAEELEHKIRSAMTRGHTRPRGYLLDAKREARATFQFLRPADGDGGADADADDPVASRTVDDAWPVQILGYDGDAVVLYQRHQHQILRYGPHEFTDRTLVHLFGKSWLESVFPAANGRKAFASLDAYDVICGLARARGRFSGTRVRGRGAWDDRGRIVYNIGDQIVHAGKPVDNVSSLYVYQGGESFSFDRDAPPMTDEMGRELCEIAESFSWVDPTSALLLCGWVVLAPLAGVLPWRPHIWLTGGAGTGKTTIQSSFVERLLRDVGVMFLFGASTESGIRQTLRGDAVPVLLDEAESKTEFDAGRLEVVIGMIRRASSQTGGRETRGTPRGGAISYTVSSMFCLSSITVGIKNTEDRDRISLLSLESSETSTPEHWRALEARLAAIPANASSQLYARIMAHADVLLANVRTFRRVAGAHFGRARAGDQIGTLLAGASFLVSTDEIDPDGAAKIVRDFCDLSPDGFHVEKADEADRVLDALFSAQIQLASGERRSLAWVVISASRRLPMSDVQPGDQMDARDALLRNGMRIRKTDGHEYLLIANGSRGVAALMRGTPYATDLRGELLRLRALGIRSLPHAQRFGREVRRVVAIPVELCDRYLDDDP